MYCAHCGAEIMTYLDDEWEYCPKCERYTHASVKKIPKGSWTGRTREYVMFQSIINMLMVFIMTSTRLVQFCFEDTSAVLGVFCLLVLFAIITFFVVLEESNRGIGQGHLTECIILQISMNIFYFLMVLALIRETFG